MSGQDAAAPTAVLFGGAGFIGSHLAQHLTAKLGYRVMIADLRQPATRVPKSEATIVDVRGPIPLEVFPARPDLVVNLAAIHREPGHQPHEYYETNVGGALNVSKFCDAVNATNLVFVSSISVYGPSEQTKRESDRPAPTTDYGRTKLLAEEIHRGWRNQAPDARRLTIVRPAVVFGPGEGGNFARLGKALQGRRFVYPGRRDARKASGYVTDLVRSIEFVQRQTDLENLYNFGFPEAPTLEDVCRAFARAAGVRPPRLTIPTALMLLAGTVGDWLGPLGRPVGLSRRRIEKLVSSTNISADHLAQMGFEHEFDLEGALRDWLAHEPSGSFV